jgi:hypothetical protein
MTPTRLVAFTLVAIGIGVVTTARADNYEQKRIRQHRIPIEQSRIECKKQAVTSLGANVPGRRNPYAVLVRSWTDPKVSPTIGTETVKFEIESKKSKAGDMEVAEVRYTSETGVTTVYRQGVGTILSLSRLQKHLLITVLPGLLPDIWMFRVNLETGLGMKTETIMGNAVFAAAYECH